MDHHQIATAVPEEHEVGGGTKEIWKVTGILSVLTIVELALGFWMMGMPDGGLRWSIKGAIIILMLAKAFYIVGYFMHLRHEIRNLIMTIIVPLLLFVWFIIAFLADGHSFNKLKTNYNHYYKDHSSQKMEQQEPEEKKEEEHKETKGGQE